MAKDILKEIVDRRIEDMEKFGIQFGFDIPAERQRPVHPFIVEKGVILEVKRASPSKGDIAPDLDSGATARSYAEAGAGAISCLTETNYFKGTLEDLMKVCAAVDEYEKETGKNGPAVLRKDFLISPEEVEVAYRAGADAVLLISRILDTPTMISMAKKCQELGITALVELRLEEDVEKLAKVIEQVDKKYLVAGVNSRDLRDFTIDLLTPCSMKDKISKAMGDRPRIIFESGIRTPESAAFVGSLGFTGMLLGEAAAKNPQVRTALVKAFTGAKPTANAAFWNKYSTGIDKNVQRGQTSLLPKVKICGMTNLEDALLAARLGADYFGFIFWKKSPRYATVEVVKQVREIITKEELTAKLVGVIVDPADEEAQTAISMAKEGILDILQLHTMDCARKFLAVEDNRSIPHYAAINISSEDDLKNLDELFDLGEPRVLVDAQTQGKIGGTGKQISPELVEKVQKKYKLWLAGGLSPDNIQSVNTRYSPELVDCASGIEAQPGKKDKDKVQRFFAELKQ